MKKTIAIALALALILLPLLALLGCQSSWQARMVPGGEMTAGENHSTAWPIGESAVQFGRVTHANLDGTTTTSETLTMLRSKNTIGGVTLAGIAAGAAVAVAGGGSPPAVGAGAAVAGAGAVIDGVKAKKAKK